MPKNLVVTINFDAMRETWEPHDAPLSELQEFVTNCGLRHQKGDEYLARQLDLDEQFLPSHYEVLRRVPPVQ